MGVIQYFSNFGWCKVRVFDVLLQLVNHLVCDGVFVEIHQGG